MTFAPQLLEALRTAQLITVFTGAGVSAESGIPTFRDAQTGLWANYRPEDLATPEAFMRNPVTVWNWYAERRKQIQQVKPNPAHIAIAKLETLGKDVTVVTQNVDNLHELAGSSKVIKLHGDILESSCFECGRPASGMEDQSNIPPRCQSCNGMLRPAVVWFGEALPANAWHKAASLMESADVVFCVGTSSLVEPAASLPRQARYAGAVIVQINPEATSHDAISDYVLRERAGDVFPKLIEAAWPDLAK